jgi:transposase-like protein
LTAQSVAGESVELLEAGSRHKRCPHCAGERIVRNGSADGLQRYKCRACGKTFNVLTGNFDRRIALGMLTIVAGAVILSWPDQA